MTSIRKSVHISVAALIFWLGVAVAIGVAVGRVVQTTTPVSTKCVSNAGLAGEGSSQEFTKTPSILPGVEIGKPISAAWMGSKRCFAGWCAQPVWGTYTLDMGRACVGPNDVVLWWTSGSSLEPITHTNGTPYGETPLTRATSEATRLIANYKAAGFEVESQPIKDPEQARYRLTSPDDGHLVLTVTGGASNRDSATVMLQPEGIAPIACRK